MNKELPQVKICEILFDDLASKEPSQSLSLFG